MWFVWIIMSLSLFGCVGCALGEPVGLSELSAMQSDDDEGEKNLAAIRAMIAKERLRTSFTTSESNDIPKSERESYSWPSDWLSQYFSPSLLPVEESALSSEHVAPSSPALSTRQTTSGTIMAPSPWVPKSSSRGFEAEPWPPVPPYTLSAPAGSVYPGTIRCVPDMLGGQRCHAD
jgi:hypothetical protein